MTIAERLIQKCQQVLPPMTEGQMWALLMGATGYPFEPVEFVEQQIDAMSRFHVIYGRGWTMEAVRRSDLADCHYAVPIE